MQFKVGDPVRLCKPGSPYHYRCGTVEITRKNGQVFVYLPSVGTYIYVYPMNLMSTRPLSRYAKAAAWNRVNAWIEGRSPVI